LTGRDSVEQEFTLAANDDAPAAARAFVRSVLESWRFDTTDTVLATSEAVAQAVLNAVTERITVSVRNLPGRRVRVEVSDDDHRAPDLSDGSTSLSFLVIERIAEDWGLRHFQSDGEIMWFEIDAPRREPLD
jgi:anti-sigma regulatory factor (Ser/Thr protein kinase)